MIENVLIDIGEQPWQRYAACADKPTEWFFPPAEVQRKGRNITPYLEWRARAVAICDACPAINGCRDFADKLHGPHPGKPMVTGIWGGEDDYQRFLRIKKKKKCRNCQVFFTLDHYAVKEKSLDGFNPYCVKCVPLVLSGQSYERRRQIARLERIRQNRVKVAKKEKPVPVNLPRPRVYRDATGHFISKHKWELMNA